MTCLQVLLAGDYRDPMVGRDVLAGALLGLCHTAAIYSTILLTQMLDGSSGPGQVANPSKLTGFSPLLADFFTRIGTTVFAGLAPMFFLLLLYLFTRKRWLAAILMWLTISTVQVLFFGLPAAHAWSQNALSANWSPFHQLSLPVP